MQGFPQNDYIELAQKENHSEQYINLISCYVNSLTCSGYPVIFSLKHLSKIIGVTYYDLINITGCRERYYISYEISKKSGGKRLLTCPNKILKNIQRWINSSILVNYKLSDCCTGFRKGMSIKQNAEFHVNQPYVLKLDLIDFFSSINEYRIYNVFKKMGYHTNLSVYLAQLVTVDIDSVYTSVNDFDNVAKSFGVAVLPQGSPTSPYLANIVASKLDERLNKLSRKLDVRYSRYADDSAPRKRSKQLARVA